MRKTLALVGKRRQAVVLAAMGVSLAWLYAGVFAGMVRQWHSDANYSHGFIVLPLAAFFVWDRRAALQKAPVSPVWGGLAVATGSLLLYAAGTLGAELFLTRISLVGFLAGAVLYLYGAAHARILAFPLAFLLLMVPLPALVFNQIAFPLQLLASHVGEVGIRAAGIPVLREGNLLQLPSRTLEVAEACSGIRSLISLLLMAIVLAYFSEPRQGRRVVIALAAVPIAVLANALRVAGTGIASEYVSPAAAEGVLHTFSGWVVFIVACAGLMAVQRALSHAAVPAAQPRSLGGAR